MDEGELNSYKWHRFIKESNERHFRAEIEHYKQSARINAALIVINLVMAFWLLPKLF